MKNTLYTIAVIIFTTYNIFSQQHSLTGKFINHEQNPIEFAKVSIYQDDTVFVNVTITDSLGVFSLTIQEGVYTVKLEKTNIEYWINIIELNKNIDLGTIQVDETKILSEITITNERPLWVRKPDRLIFNVENSISASSGTLLDALKMTPGVLVTQTSISIIGKGKALILIDERNVNIYSESLMNYLSSISAESIQSIEVMTNPPAKYDAQGSGGIINIIYKKGRRNSWKNNTRVASIHDFYSNYFLFDNFYYNKGKIYFDIHASVRKGNIRLIDNTETDYPDQKWVEKGHSKVGNDGHSQRIVFDYQLSDNASIGTLVEFSQTLPQTDYSKYEGKVTQENKLISEIYTNNRDKRNENFFSSNINYIQNFGQKTSSKKGELQFNFDYFNNDNKKQNYFDSKHTYLNGVNILHTIGENKSNLNIENYSGKIDLNYLDGTIECGGKMSSTTTSSDFTFFDLISYDNKINKFRYIENINALYFNWNKEFDYIHFGVGLRYEHTLTKSYSEQKNEINIHNYNNLYPTIALTYLTNENTFFNLSYNRRVNRPAFWELDPFRTQINAYSYEEGNPFLKHSFSHNVTMDYNYQQVLNLQFSFQKSTQESMQFTRLDSITKIQATLRDNFISSESYTLSTSYIFDECTKWESQFYLEFYYTKTRITKKLYENIFLIQNGIGGVFDWFNSITPFVNQNIKLELSYQYTFPTKMFIYKDKGTHNINLALLFVFYNEKIKVRIYGNDIFRSSIPYSMIYSEGMKQKISVYQEPRSVILSLNYSFGNSTIRTLEKETGNKEEQNRSRR